MLNSRGLENKGAEYFVQTALPFLEKYDTKVFASIAGNDAGEYGALAARLSAEPRVHAIEINLSCPNVTHGCGRGLFCQNAQTSAQIVAAVKAAAKKPVFAKLSAMVADITQISLACQEAGADGLTLINTLPAMMVDLKTRKPAVGNASGGLSGGCIKPVALKTVWDVYRAVKIPIIGSGGIMNANDALEFILCGASAVQIGSANFVNTLACKEIAEGIVEYFQKNNLRDITQLRGQLKL
jgi:dihydroorotate dehydrogenase (NAD+) catalytic subunit